MVFGIATILAGCLGRGAPGAAEAEVTRGTASPMLFVERCAAENWRPDLLGRPESAAHKADLPAGHRILHPGSVMQQDYDALRLNVTVNRKGRIDGVYCG
ncbi:I78 family peptidase inhibitor [Gemmobacter serpentinus]|uniref:I78 family peptidase inhibitor n=1 Tax=Gemmobacter serpentinus TaxID=2652247 RepID=UPI00186580B8|nr:I78 family peptidase inhibitor [Gemmobacter serpentinus]